MTKYDSDIYCYSKIIREGQVHGFPKFDSWSDKIFISEKILDIVPHFLFYFNIYVL